MKRCKRCGKRWCGTDLKLRKLYPEEYADDGDLLAPEITLDSRIVDRVTFGSKKCRKKGPKR